VGYYNKNYNTYYYYTFSGHIRGITTNTPHHYNYTFYERTSGSTTIGGSRS